MRFVIKNTCYIIFLVLCFFDAQAQFNTLVSSAPKTSNKYTPEVVNEELPAKEKKEFWNIFSPGKKRLQKQVDSLQAIIQSTQKKEVNIKKIEDSLETVLMKRVFSEVIHSKEKETIKKNIPKIAMPIKGNLHLTSDYGMRVHPIHNQWKMHNGIDLRANNQFVYAVLEGVVSEIGYDDSAGLFIKIKHNNDYETSYLHLSEIYYKKDEKVKAGYIIGRSGNTGGSTAPHLHFAVKENNKYINPLYFLRDLVEINNLKNLIE